MVDPQVIDYIKQAKAAGQPDEQIKSALLGNGWSEQEISENFQATMPIASNPVNDNIAPASAKPMEPSSVSTNAIGATSNIVADISSPQTTQPVFVKEKSRPRKGIGGLIVSLLVILILLGAGGTAWALYANIWNPSWNPFHLIKSNPEAVIEKAWNNLATIKSENFNSTLSLTSKGVQTANATGSLGFNVNATAHGGIDNSNPANKLADIQASLTASATNPSAPGTNYNISVTGEGRLIQKDLYVDLTDINLGGLESFLAMFGVPDLSTIKGQWFKFQPSDLSQQSTTQPAQVNSAQQDALNKIVKIFSDNKVYDITQMPDNQSVSGKEYHYYVSLNQQKIIEVSPQIFEVLNNYYIQANPGQPIPTEYTLANFQKGINDAFTKIGKIGVDLYIGQKDNYFHKIQFTKDLDVGKLDSKYSGIVTINYEIDQATINQPVQVSAPDKFIDFKDFVTSLSQPVLPSPLKAAMGQIGSAAQTIFFANNNYNLLCKNGFLNGSKTTSYGIAFVNAANAIRKQGAKNPICFSGIQDYCVSTQLADGTYICVGKGNVVGNTKCVDYKTACK